MNWKPYKNYEGLYLVSDCGNVMNAKRGTILTPSPDSNGYMRVNLSKNRKVTTTYVHRMVAQTFKKTTRKNVEVNHMDGNKANNSIDNLEWMTHKENIRYGHANGQWDPKKFGGKARPVMDKDWNVYENSFDCAEKLGITYGYVRNMMSPKHPDPNRYGLMFIDKIEEDK